MSVKVKRYGKVLILIVMLLSVLVLAAATVTRMSAQSDTPRENDDDPNNQYNNQYTTLISRDVREITAERNYNHRLWRVVKEFEVVDPDTGTTNKEQIISTIVEAGCGICYRDKEGNFQVTDTNWQETREGFLMDTAAYELQVGRTVGCWLRYTIDGDDLYLRVAGINANDGVNAVTAAELDGNVEAVIDPCNGSRLVFAEAFGKGIDLVLQARAGGYHQDVIFHEPLRLPDYLNPETTDVFLYTELSLDDYCQNQGIEVSIGRDEYVDVNEYLNTAATLENIAFTKVVEEKGCLFTRDCFRFVDSKVYDSRVGAGANHAFAHKQLFRDEDDKTYLIETLSHSFFRGAAYPIVWDYETSNGTLTKDEIWYANATYYISSDVTIGDGATLRIEPGTFVKFNDDTKLTVNGTGKLIARGKPHMRIHFTSKHDNYNGEDISGSSGNHARGDYVGLEIGDGSEIEFCMIGFAQTGLKIMGVPGIPVRHNHIRANSICSIEIDSNALDGLDPNETLLIFNNEINGNNNAHIKIAGSQGKIVIRNNTLTYGAPYGIYIAEARDDEITIENNIFAYCTITGIYYDPFAYDPNFIYNDYNGYYNTDPCNIGVPMGNNDVCVDQTPFFTDTLNPFLGGRQLNKNQGGGSEFINAGNCSVAEAGYDDPCQWMVHNPLEDPCYVYNTVTTISSDATWQPNYTTCDIGTVALGYHHTRVDYIIHKANVTVNSATLEVRPSTVVAHRVDSVTGNGKLTIENDGSLICKGDPYDGGYITWVEFGRAGHYWQAGGWQHYPNTNIHVDGSDDNSSAFCEIAFTRFLGLGLSLNMEEAESELRDCIFMVNRIGPEYKNCSSYDCQNCLLVGNAHGLKERSSNSGYVKNCTFSNNESAFSSAYHSTGDFEVINCLFHTNLSGLRDFGDAICSESYNVFYCDPCDIYNYEFSQFGDLDGTDRADPNTVNAYSLNGDPFDNSWSDFDDRFHLAPCSDAVDNGYDPLNAGMVGYTTNIQGGADTAPIDIGYHYPEPNDTDGDGLLDYQEYRGGTDYQDFDSDNDGLVDGYDGFISVNVYPEGIDSNEDGYVDSEHDAGTDPLDNDSDNDGMPDGWEFLYSLNPLSDDADEDYDNDEYSNIIEFVHGSIPNDNESLPQNIILDVPLDVDSVQMAVDWSINGDTIRIEAGIYKEQINLKGKNIILTGSDPCNAETVSATIINGEENGSTVTFDGSENTNAQLIGLTITGGHTDGHGGGVCGNGAAAQIQKCVIHNNYSVQNGGAIHNINGVISDCVIIQNTADGAGGGLADCDAVVTNCVITQNTASLGGGIYNTSSILSLFNCTITGNYADYGGGFYSHNESASITNTILWGNTAQAEGDEVYNNSASPIFSYCDVGGCGGSRGGNWQSFLGTDGGHNVDLDPLFVNANSPAGVDDIFRTPDDGLRLCVFRSQEKNAELQDSSSCLDYGDSATAPSTDITGRVRVDIPYIPNLGAGTVNYSDLGAYESPIIWYVKSGDLGIGDGSSWESAFTDLQAALSAADDPNNPVVDYNPDTMYSQEIWVAKGVYKPAKYEGSSSKTISFEMISGVDLYGGFQGTETARHERDRERYETTLSGTIDPCSTYTRSYHVVRGADYAVIDGFILTEGNAKQSSYEPDSEFGGGMLNNAVSPKVIHCIFKNNKGEYGGGMANINGAQPLADKCTFFGNHSYDGGGGIYNNESDPSITDCVFLSNSSTAGAGMYNDTAAANITNCEFISNATDQHGGGIYNNRTSTPAITDCLFHRNEAGRGGGIYNDSSSGYPDVSPQIIGCRFINNKANGTNGQGGGICSLDYYSSTPLTGCSFWGNSARSGGGLYITRSSGPIENCTFHNNRTTHWGGGIYIHSSDHSDVINCNFTENTSQLYGGGLYIGYSLIEITNCIQWDNTAEETEGGDEIYIGNGQTTDNLTINYCNIKGGWDGNGIKTGQYFYGSIINGGANLNLDPCFVNINDPNGLDGLAGTYDDGLRLRLGSPCIDAGYNGVWPEPNEANGYHIPIDIAGVPRVQDGGSDGSEVVDLGTYEFGGIIAYDQDVQTDEDTQVPVILDACDIANDAQVFSIVVAPLHGDLTGDAPNLIYSPNPNFHGLDSFVFAASDGINRDSALISVTVLPTNDPPDATDDSVLAKTNESITIDVLANDFHPDDDALTVVLVSDPDPNGTAVINEDNSITYNPVGQGGYFGPVNFVYTIADEDDPCAETDTANVQITVHCAPEAVNDSCTTQKNILLKTTNVLNNDIDMDGDDKVIRYWTTAAHGLIRYNGEGIFFYMPHKGYIGDDEFTYLLMDPAGNADVATVSITITSTPSDPCMIDTDGDGIYDADENELYETNPYFADTDGDGMSDGWEVLWGLDPLIWDDSDADPDEDGLSNRMESIYNTNPYNPDTDGDGMSDGWEVEYGSDPTDPNDSQEKYYPHPLPYQTTFAEFDGGDIDGQQGWQVTQGCAYTYWGRGLEIFSESIVRKEFEDEGTDHSYLRFYTYWGVPTDAEIRVLTDEGDSEAIIAALKFGVDFNVYVYHNDVYIDSGTDWDPDTFGTMTHDPGDITFKIDYSNHKYSVFWDINNNDDPEPIYEDACFASCDTLCAVEIQTKQHFLVFVKISVTDYEDPILYPDRNCPVEINTPCHCDENHISTSRTPIIGSIWLDTLAWYNLGFCSFDKDPENLNNWVKFDWGTGVVENGILGYWDTGSTPNGYYYIGVQVINGFGQAQMYIQTDQWGNYAPVIVVGDLKCNTFHYETEPDISVAWPGQFPFELKRIYDNNRRFEYRPFPYGWQHNFHITLMEDTRYYWDYGLEVGFLGGPYGDHNFLGYGDIWIRYPDGSVKMFRHDQDQHDFEDGTTGEPSRFYPYPDNNTGELIERITTAHLDVGYYDIDNIEYRLIQRDGTTLLFTSSGSEIEDYPSGYNFGHVGWQIKTGVEEISDRFGNTLKVDWFHNTDKLTVKSVAYDNNTPTDSSDDTKIEFEIEKDRPECGGFYNDFYTKAQLKVAGKVYRTVKYSYGQLYPGTLSPYWNFKALRTGALAEHNGSYNPDANDVIAHVSSNIVDLWATSSWRSLRWIFHTESPQGSGDIYVTYDKWARVASRFDMIDSDMIRETQYEYKFYHPDLDGDPSQSDPCQSPADDRVSYLRTTAINPYQCSYAWQTDKGALLKQQIFNFDYSIAPIVTSKYENEDYSLKPTETMEYFDGFVRKTDNTYNSEGDLTHQVVRDEVSQQNLLSTSINYYSAYPFPIRKTTTPSSNQPGHKTETQYTYGKADGTVDAITPKNNKYLIKEKTLLTVNPDDPDDPCDYTWAVTNYYYADNGQIIKKVDPCGVSTVLLYDDYHFKQWVKVGAEGSEQPVQRFCHDPLGQVRLQTNHLGGVTLYDYDGFGHLRQVRTYNDPCALDTEVDFTPSRYANRESLSTTIYGYDKKGNRVHEQKPADGVVQTRYTRNRLPKRVEYDTEWGAYIEYEYDLRGKKILERYKDPNNSQLDWQVSRNYDSMGRQIGTMWYDYDDETIIKGQLSDYYASGKKKWEKIIGPDLMDELCLQRHTIYDYDIFGKLIEKTIAPDTNYTVATGYGYDVLGNRLNIIDPAGNITWFDYDNANRRTADYFTASAATSKENATQKSATQYYLNNKIASETSFDYDGSTVLSHTEFGYDERSRLAQVRQFMDDPFDPCIPDLCTAVTGYDYSDSGFGPNDAYNLRITDAEGKITYRDMDGFGRLAEILYPSGDYQEMEYNGDGTLKQRTVFNNAGDPCEIVYDYDVYGRLERINYPKNQNDPCDVVITFVRDGFGRKLQAIDDRGSSDNIGGSGSISYEYDPLGRVIARTDQDGYQVSYKYWADGQKGRINVADPCDDNIYRVEYYQHPNGRMRGVYEPLLDPGDQFIAQLAYDDNGNRSQLEYYLEGDYYGDYVTIDYKYNHDNYLTGYNTTPYGTADDPCSCLYNVTLDGLGRLTAATEIITKTDSSDVTHAHTYNYDMLSQLTDAAITNINGSTWTAGYDYNKDGNIQTRTINGDPCDYEYDGDLLIAAQGQDLDWDLNGNLTTGISSSLTYNWDNKLQSATRGSNSIALKYDPDDNRVWKKTTNNQNVTYRKYIIAEIDSLPVILLEIDPCDSVIKKSYVYAGDQIIMQHDGGMNADKYFYIHDRLGSVRQVIDVNASVKHLYSYGPFGKKLEADDDPCAPGNPFQFTGLYFDYEIDQHYARARQFSTELFRFTSRDPVVGNFNEPLTLHAYLYCLNDSVNRTDPSGKYSKEEVTTTSTIGGGMGAAGGSQAGHLLQRARDFADMMSQRNWLYGQTIANMGDRVDQWTKAMNRIGMQVHHIVGKGWGNVATYGKEMINSFNNLIAIDPASHSQITSFFNSGYRVHGFMANNPDVFGKVGTLQQFLSKLSLAEQFNWGQAALMHLATYGSLANFNPSNYGLIP